MRKMTKRTAAGVVLGGSLLFTGGLGIASAAPAGDISDGLVNLGVGNTNLLTDVDAGVASKVAADICGTSANAAELDMKTTQVDAGTTTSTSCNSAQGMVTISQNGTEATPQSGPVTPQNPAATPGQPSVRGHAGSAEMGQTPAVPEQAPAMPAPVTPIG
jgi:hypothetical protein